MTQDEMDRAQLLWHELEQLQALYPTFDLFLREVIEVFMGFNCTDIQIDIGDWISNGPLYRMVQAQRGQAKTTITAAYAVWRLIHDPSTRVLIISAGSDMAAEIANWVIQIIMGMPELAMLRPDTSHGDRCAVTAFDVCYLLKGPEKSPSVACVGITSNLQGKRADVLIADDIESTKNASTAVQRARLHHLTLDFTSICSNGDIIWLGTPQSIDSIYNGLPGRGTQIRVWPGRYPTLQEQEDYEGFLAPLIASRLAADPSLRTGGGPTGDRGQAIDPVLLGEATLTAKEIDQGPAYFQLQHMLSTKLSDQERYPLKIGQIRFCAFDPTEGKAPLDVTFVRTGDNEFSAPPGFPLKDKLYRVQKADNFAAITPWHMHVDPAGGGQNGDETGWSITGMCGGRIINPANGGVAGGLNEAELDAMTAIAVKWKVATICVEKNFGNGAFHTVWLPNLFRAYDRAGLPRPGVEEVWESGQKELRIIDVLGPIIGNGKLLMTEDALIEDIRTIQKYPSDKRQTYSLIFQLARITREKKSLLHEDRLDALAGSCRRWIPALSIDAQKQIQQAKQDLYNRMMANPLGNGRPMPGYKEYSQPNALAKHGLGGQLGRIKR